MVRTPYLILGQTVLFVNIKKQNTDKISKNLQFFGVNMFCNNISGNAISRKPDSEAKVRSLIETRNPK